MIPLDDLLLFALTALLLVLTPGPNMIYLLSRSICQGPGAGAVSLIGVVAGLIVHVFAAAFGLSALFLAVPFGYELLKWAGAGWLLWMAWQSVRPGSSSPFEARLLPIDPPGRLLTMGFLTSLLNPKIAVFYLSIFPQFVSPDHGSVLVQSLLLGAIQIMLSFTINLTIALCAGRLSRWFARHATWLAVQRYVMGSVLAGLAVRLAMEPRRGG